MGAVNYFTNDPELTQIGFSETEFFSKEIRQGHPLYPIKNNLAGVFLGDTSNPSWNIVHKFLPPALGPKAVRHYGPTMNGCLDESLPIFDELEENGDAWNVYQYMLKLSSGTVGKIMLGKDLEHFKSVDAPLHPLVVAIAEQLAVNKKVTSKGEWFKYLPFVGDTAKMKSLQSDVHKQVEQLMGEAKLSGDESLPLQDAALKANNVIGMSDPLSKDGDDFADNDIDYLVRATDSNGVRLPKENLLSAVLVASGAGFTTTSSLLSWCIFGLATYAGTQARLLQELVDHDITDETNITADQIDELPELDKFIKEMQRRHNPSYQPGRTALRDMVLPGGYKLKEGSVLILALHHLHTNSKIWENPDKFDPDRWDTDAVKHRHKAAYVPFATGQRMCIGFNFALLEVKIFICKLVWRYHWEKEGEAETEYDPFFQLIRPLNLYVRTQKRTTFPSKSEGVK